MSVERYPAAELREVLAELITAYHCCRGNSMCVCVDVSLKQFLFYQTEKL